MREAAWIPFGAESESLAEFDGLHDGVPDWLTESFWAWVEARFTHSAPYQAGGYTRYEYSFRLPLLRKTERVCRYRVEYTGTQVTDGMKYVRARTSAAGLELRLADFLLSEGEGGAKGASDLGSMLLQAGSAWTTGQRSGRAGLLKRVEGGVQSSAERVFSSAGHAGQRLSDAWTAAFGIDPNPSHAYSLAIKAVEDATIPRVSPTDTAATLGKIIGQLKAGGDWSLPLDRESTEAPSSHVILAMLRMLWAGQSDRHGGPEQSIVPISQAAAETAVLVALPLVQLFTSGAISRGGVTNA